ncbi:restriction endonuclease [Kitasatospora sp. NBC_00240]|uniref:restriction endonuclease n=1 Tax=Kitasatospora sp. NBC_00240 TaxID=2903567 RepID=UPI002251592A|nr:restriction endonuclease [Kitasatospora sp. NBC_00240]MCX5213153.1 restriction endonuclease [Kitasatospora sp. NBC_00240]
MGDVLRYTAAKDTAPAAIDGFGNFYFVTDSPGQKRALLEAGINAMAKVKTSEGMRRPAVMIRSSPWKAGSEQTPWHDVFDVTNGHVRYFGDHKPDTTKPVGSTTGNAALLEAFDSHQAPTAVGRAAAAPLLLFRSVSKNGKVKGHVEFCGVGLIERAERVLQWGGPDRTTFTNYVFDLVVVDLAAEDDKLDWDWVTARRDPGRSDAEVLKLAPAAWREWVKHGHSVLPKVRRRVARAQVVKVRDQKPATGSKVEADLQAVYKRFDDDKHAFEVLAAIVAAKVMRASGHSYDEGWLTRRSGDGGADFVGRLDLGSGLAGTKLVVLGQAKCIKPGTLVAAEQIARVVARLRRGWIGVYVTTGSYSEPAQLEMVEDQYPVVLINGQDLIKELYEIAGKDHGGDLMACVEDLLSSRSLEVLNRRPEEILLD